jgi:hypothetical protein
MQTINFWSPKGGIGKSTLATQFAIALTMNDIKVAFYDLDKQKSSSQYFSRIEEKFRPTQIFDNINQECNKDIDFRVYDFPPNTDYIPMKGSVIVAPTGSSTFELSSYKRVLELEESHTVIKVLNKYSFVSKQDREALLYFKNCCVIGINSAIPNALDSNKTIFNFSHPNISKALHQFQFLVDCIMEKKTVEMTEERIKDIIYKGKRLNEYTN